jgi:hypothetical protein
MLLKDLYEHGTANPFVSLVSSLDFRISQLMQAQRHPLPSFISSVDRQLHELYKLIDSAKRWEIPEEGLHKQLHFALPIVLQHITSVISLVKAGHIDRAVKLLDVARDKFAERSGLKFDASPFSKQQKP